MPASNASSSAQPRVLTHGDLEVTLPPGFQPLNLGKPIRIYRRNLPHWRQTGATYFVTFRQLDSIPYEVWTGLQREAADWIARVEREEGKHGGKLPESLSLEYETFQHRHLSKVEGILDSGLGSCVLTDPSVRQLVTDSLNFFEGKRYHLHAFVVMPNHVHLCVTPLEGWELEDVIHSWKGFMSKQINAALNRTGSLWQGESYDRIIRDPEHFARVIRYIGRNGVKAGLKADAYSVWMGCGRWLEDGEVALREDEDEYGASFPA